MLCKIGIKQVKRVTSEELGFGKANPEALNDSDYSQVLPYIKKKRLTNSKCLLEQKRLQQF
jgi:hypothetical protein